jgi:hypothetical protein
MAGFRHLRFSISDLMRLAAVGADEHVTPGPIRGDTARGISGVVGGDGTVDER